MSAPELKDNVDSDIQKRLAALAHERVPKPSKEVNNDDNDEAPTFSKKKKRKTKLDEEYEPDFNIKVIKNKERRTDLWLKLKVEKKKEKNARREAREKERKALGDAAPPKEVPKTLDNCRDKDVTTIKTGKDVEADEEVEKDLEKDEFSTYFERSYVPKVLITTDDNPCSKTRYFVKELERIIPNAELKWRNNSSIKKMVTDSIERGFSDIVIVNEYVNQPNQLIITHLPDGPTAHFKLTNVKIAKNLKKDFNQISAHRPEVILNNFTTRLGHGVARMLASLFHYDPEFEGKRVCTLHNQRDYIFFRHHKYHIKTTEKVRLHELGPRFTLKLQWLQEGTFDSKYGEYEWMLSDKRHQLETGKTI
jgi:ribosome production factor 1